MIMHLFTKTSALTKALASRRAVLPLLAAALAALIFGASRSGDARDEEKPRGGLATQPAAKIGEKGSQNQPSSVPAYDPKGDLKRPTGYEKWIFVGSNLGLEYREDNDKKDAGKADAPDKLENFHNVYINPEAYEHYLRTGTFPEKTMLVLDIYKAEKREPGSIVAEGLYPGKQIGIALAVKNSARPDGGKTAWAYYDFGLDQKTAKAFPNKACYDCHLQHADDDCVWVQMYPTLKRVKDAAKVPAKESTKEKP
jgi:Cytochrome P460